MRVFSAVRSALVAAAFLLLPLQESKAEVLYEFNSNSLGTPYAANGMTPGNGEMFQSFTLSSDAILSGMMFPAWEQVGLGSVQSFSLSFYGRSEGNILGKIYEVTASVMDKTFGTSYSGGLSVTYRYFLSFQSLFLAAGDYFYSVKIGAFSSVLPDPSYYQVVLTSDGGNGATYAIRTYNGGYTEAHNFMVPVKITGQSLDAPGPIAGAGLPAVALLACVAVWRRRYAG